jgi:hypothetical protein
MRIDTPHLIPDILNTRNACSILSCRVSLYWTLIWGVGDGGMSTIKAQSERWLASMANQHHQHDQHDQHGLFPGFQGISDGQLGALK